LTGLDTPSQEGILKLLDRLKNENVTVMVATHDLDQAATHFDRIMLLNHRIISFGEPGSVMQTENLINAYGGRLRSTEDGNIMAIDDCCDDESDH
jgi:ABC-type Mn2+/Zn2+ transport system ATPase subunit